MFARTMTTRNWWLLALVATAVICLGVVGLSDGIGPRFAVGAGILVAYTVARRRPLRGSGLCGPRAELAS